MPHMSSLVQLVGNRGRKRGTSPIQFCSVETMSGRSDEPYGELCLSYLGDTLATALCQIFVGVLSILLLLSIEGMLFGGG